MEYENYAEAKALAEKISNDIYLLDELKVKGSKLNFVNSGWVTGLHEEGKQELLRLDLDLSNHPYFLEVYVDALKRCKEILTDKINQNKESLKEL